jgi:hypothetical protein
VEIIMSTALRLLQYVNKLNPGSENPETLFRIWMKYLADKGQGIAHKHLDVGIT